MADAADEKTGQTTQPADQEPEQQTQDGDVRQQTEPAQQQVEPAAQQTEQAPSSLALSLQQFIDNNAVGAGIAGLLFLAFVFFVAARSIRRLLTAARARLADLRLTSREVVPPMGGLVLLALAIWFFGPLVTVGGWQPLAGTTMRVATIAVLFVLAVIGILSSSGRGRDREASRPEGSLKGDSEDAEAQPAPQRQLEESIADSLISDRPLGPDDPDPLGYGAIARGISRFLRNEKTEPPLTMAINGPWGSGKSSIMNLLKADMEGYDYRPVWFNAWHHQKEEHLLAALLETLRVSGFPPVWTRHGLYFRWRLFCNRTRERPLPLMLVGGLLALQAGLALAGALEETTELLKSDWTLAPGVAAIAGFLLILHTRFRNTLLDPSRLATDVAGRFRVGRFRDKLSFRHRFAKEFHDVAEAMKPLRMVILIDDLDRCRPSNVLAALEAVNFLATSGDCFIIMGLDRDRVLDCVGHEFKEVAEEVIRSAGAGDAGAKLNAHAKRREFAEQYLEKLINIEVSVPPLEHSGAGKLLESAVDKGTKNPRPEPTEALALSGPWRWGVAGFLAVGALAFGFGKLLVGDWRFGSGATQGAGGPGGQVQASNAPSLPQIENPEAWLLAAGLGLLVLFALAVAASAAGFRRRLEVIGAMTADSSDFTKALEIWRPLIVNKFQTPRALKRFLNRLRYLAMCNRRETGGEHSQVIEVIDETTLVALATANLCLPKGLADMPVGLWKASDAPASEVKASDAPASEGESADAPAPGDGAADAPTKANGVLAGIIKEHRESFAGRELSEPVYKRFVKIASGVRVN